MQTVYCVKKLQTWIALELDLVELRPFIVNSPDLSKRCCVESSRCRYISALELTFPNSEHSGLGILQKRMSISIIADTVTGCRHYLQSVMLLLFIELNFRCMKCVQQLNAVVLDVFFVGAELRHNSSDQLPIDHRGRDY
jgi:hypothetical protein